MNDALTIVGAFFTAGIGTFLAVLILAYLFRNKDYGLDEGHMVGAVVLAVIAGIGTAGFVAGSLWF